MVTLIKKKCFPDFHEGSVEGEHILLEILQALRFRLFVSPLLGS